MFPSPRSAELWWNSFSLRQALLRRTEYSLHLEKGKQWFLSPFPTGSTRRFSEVHCEALTDLLGVKVWGPPELPSILSHSRVLTEPPVGCQVQVRCPAPVLVPARLCPSDVRRGLRVCVLLRRQQLAATRSVENCSLFSLFSFFLIRTEWQLLHSLHSGPETGSAHNAFLFNLEFYKIQLKTPKLFGIKKTTKT